MADHFSILWILSKLKKSLKEEEDQMKALKKEDQDDKALMSKNLQIFNKIEEEEDKIEAILEKQGKEEAMTIPIDIPIDLVEEKDLREMTDLIATGLKEMMEIDLNEDQEIRITMITENKEDSCLMKNLEFKSAQLVKLFMMLKSFKTIFL